MEGLINKYNITKADGSEVDPNARYFILRYDPNQKDNIHGDACRKALRVYAEEIAEYMPRLSFDLLSELDLIES
jgi:hypothetical protein